VKEFVPDVIVLDVMLPDADGFAICERLGGRPFTAPVIFLTARRAANDRVRGLTATRPAAHTPLFTTYLASRRH
jgi:DNA-binding response OmpR family regulator